MVGVYFGIAVFLAKCMVGFGNKGINPTINGGITLSHQDRVLGCLFDEADGVQEVRPSPFQ